MRGHSVAAAAGGPRVAGGDGGLERVRTQGAAELLRAPERGQAALDEDPVPARAVLVEEQDRLPRRAGARPEARSLQLQERHETVDLRLLRGEPGQDAAEPERVLAERGAHPVLAGRRRVALVEDEVDDLEHRREPGGKVGAAGDVEGDARLGEGPLGPDDALGDRRRRDEERARDLLGGEAAEQAERERDARLGAGAPGDTPPARGARGRRPRRRRWLPRGPAGPDPDGPPARDRAPRAGARGAGLGAGGRWPGAWRWP